MPGARENPSEPRPSGSGSRSRSATRAKSLVLLRRAVQTASLLFFLYLFLETAWHPIDRAGGQTALFFHLDPLVTLTTWLASHALAAGMLLSLVTLAVTFLCGRWFCGWICPFGALHNFFTGLRAARAKARLDAGAYSAWQRSKYYVLLLFLCAALLGLSVAGWLDPFSFLFRALTTAVYPALNDAIAGLFAWLYDANPLRVAAASEPVYGFLRRHFLAAQQPYYSGNVLIGFLFGAAILLNLLRPRFWCRYICPLGALLGVVGKNPLVRLKQSEACNQCRLCLADCQGGARTPQLDHWKPAECFYCFNCQSACPTQAISLGVAGPLPDGRGSDKSRAVMPREKKMMRPLFQWLRNFVKPPNEERLDLGRRKLLLSGAAGLSSVFLLRTHPLGRGRSFSPGLVRPPGALAEEEFLARCIRCGACMKVCPTNAIHPTALEAGPQGLWSPVLDMKIGYCEYECTLCTQVCPTGAIRPLQLAEKQKIKIGLAYIDRNRCLPYAYGRTCIVCEEHCPTPQKAIWFEEVAVTLPAGEKVTVKQPRVNAELCIGCGICVNKCVIEGQPAILVSSPGETRNRANAVLLGS